MTARYCVAGFPIAHSRSPLIHGHWLRQRGLDASYDRREVTPATLPALVDDLRAGTLAGANLTVPLKEAVLPLLDAITSEARAMGAVNTLIGQSGRVLGANTDVAGFFAHLDQSCPGWERVERPVVLLGAGGGARAVLYGLLQRRTGPITIVNRSRERVEALRESFAELDREQRIAAAPWPTTADTLLGAGLVINTTALGMKGQPALPVTWPDAMPGAIASDIVYAPLDTAFLQGARRAGAVTVDGLGMLLHQAAIAFGHWFGETPAVDAPLRALIEADIAAELASGA